MSDFAKNLKDYIKEEPEKKHIKNLADRLHLSERTIERYMYGEREPSIDALMEIARYFEITLDELTGMDSSIH